MTIRNYQIYTLAFIVGAAGMSHEILASRLFAPFFGSSIYLWSSLFSAILLGLGFGNLAG
jgi:predicted membrane-bound spermidine synthase